MSSLKRYSWLLWALAGALTPLIIVFVPHQGTNASPPQVAAREASPADDRAAALRRQQEEQLAQIEARIAAQRQRLADLESIADLVPPEYRLLCVEEARRRGIEPRVLAALGWVESRWNPETVGTSGEIGIMQILPDTAAWIAQRIGLTTYDLTDPATNVHFGAAYLSWLIQEHGSLDAALATYNAGPAWRDRAPIAARSYVNRVRAATGGGRSD